MAGVKPGKCFVLCYYNKRIVVSTCFTLGDLVNEILRQNTVESMVRRGRCVLCETWLDDVSARAVGDNSIHS